jgi:hypothetical protein
VSFGRALALGVCCLVQTAPLRAQHYTYVSGTILDDSTASVPGALITVVNEDTGSRRTSVTEADGGYLVSPLEPGVYKIAVRKTGFRTMIRFGVQLTEARPARVDFKLVVGSVQETITVEASAPLLSSDDASVSTLVGRDRIENLPLNGGGLLSVLELTPGLVVTPATRGEAGQFTVDGQRPNTHYFTVDGASANSGVSGGGVAAQPNGGALPGMTAFGSLGLVSLDAVEEVRVQSSTTVAEFGRLPGAQISLASRAGTNEFHGSLLYSFRNEVLEANDWFANQQSESRPSLQLSDFSATLGGPLRRNRTFFFLSYEGLRLTQPFSWRQPVPSLASRETADTWVLPVLNLFPRPNGPQLSNGLAQWTGTFSRPSHLDIGAVRLDQAISSRVTAFGRYSETPSSTQFGPGPAVNFLDLRSRSGTFGLSVRPRSDMVLDLRINASHAASQSTWQRTDPGPLPACYVGAALTTIFGADTPCDSLLRLSLAGSGQVSFGPEGDRSQSQFQVGSTLHLNWRSHSIALGGDFRRLTPARHDVTGTFSIAADTLYDFVQTGNLWKSNSPLQDTSGVLREGSLFAEDIWRIAKRLTATFGLRWEISPGPMPGSVANFLYPASVNGFISAQRPLWNTSYTNLAPRGGIAFRPTAGGRTVIRAGGGLFNESSLSLATDLINDGPLNVSEYKSSLGLVSHRVQFGFLPSLRLPLVKQWNASVEHAFSDHDVLSASYVGSMGQDLIRRQIGPLRTTLGINDSFWFAVATNNGSSNYHGLEAQYRRRMAQGLQALLSYSWSHSIDNSSTDAVLYWAGSGLTPRRDRGPSDFDIRHSFTAGFTYELPGSRRLWRSWALDGILRARSGFPINVRDAEQYSGISLDNVFRPDLLPGVPLWIDDSSSPGGRRINPGAFHAVDGVQGNLGRNALHGFGMSQLDLALRREFFQGERRSLQLRIEAFNALNHPNFADPIRFLSNPLFGQSGSMLNLMLGTGSPGSGLAPIFQSGGARSLQITLRFRF